MTLLYFLLDLRSISPPLLRDLKQSLLQLANLYAVTRGRGEKERGKDEIPLLRDQIALCYLHKSRSPSSLSPKSLLQLANLYAVTRGRGEKERGKDEIPLLRDQIALCYLHKSRSPSSLSPELKIAYMPGGSFSLRDFHHAVNSLPMDCFLPESSESMHTGSVDQEVPLTNLLSNEALYKWGGEDVLKKLIAIGTSVFTNSEALRKSLVDAAERCVTVEFVVLEQEDVNLYNGASEKLDGFINTLHELENCVLHRCHGYPTSKAVNNMTEGIFCPLTCRELGASDLIETSVRVGEQTILFLPPFEGSPKLRRISAPITFSVIERTNLASLNEGVIMGTSYVVTPSAHELDAASDECDKSEMNTQHHGLVCSSTCNTETMRDGAFLCYYLLQPSDRGPMLLRRLAGAEEILPYPDIVRSNDLVIPEDIKNSVHATLSKVELRGYNPLQHERGFHPKLNWLVKGSSQFGSIPPRTDMSPKVHNPTHQQASILPQPSSIQVTEEEMQANQNKDESTSSCITEEWEQLLIVDEMNDSYSPVSISKPKIHNSIPAQSRPLDDKTSRILERLEAPKQLKQKAISPSLSSIVISGQMKKPLLPFDSSSSQPFKPNFQSLKRKR